MRVFDMGDPCAEISESSFGRRRDSVMRKTLIGYYITTVQDKIVFCEVTLGIFSSFNTWLATFQALTGERSLRDTSLH